MSERVVRIQDCVRCGGSHDRVIFRMFLRSGGPWREWANCPTTQEPICLRLGGGDYSNGWQPVQADLDTKEVEVPETRPDPPWSAKFAAEAVLPGNLARYTAAPLVLVPGDRRSDTRRIPSIQEMDLS